MAILFLDSMAHSKSNVLKTAVKALELMLLFAGLISVLIIVKGAIVMSYSCELVFSSLLVFWNSIRCLLSSTLYICIIINAMVVLIAISSSFHRHYENDNLDDHDISATIAHNHDVESVKSPPPPPAAPPPPPASAPPQDITEAVAVTAAATTTTTKSTRMNGTKILSQPKKTYHDKVENLFTEKSNQASPTILPKPHEIKKTLYPLVDFSSPKLSEQTKEKMLKSNDLDSPYKEKEIQSENKDEIAYNPSENENEDEDTLEATWKAITGGGKEKPKKKDLKKSDTWDVPPRRSFQVQRLDSEEVLPSTPKWKELRKSETFNDAVSMTRRGGLRRDPSMSLDEFNKQVEAFIKNFNDNMRLQRQESDQRFLDMINRGL